MLERAGECEVVTARHAAALGVRLDGRALDEYPAIEFNVGVVAQTLGSAQVRLGTSHVLVGVKVRWCGLWGAGQRLGAALSRRRVQAEVESPESQRPEEGRIHVGVEVSACAAPGSDVRTSCAPSARFAQCCRRFAAGLCCELHIAARNK